MSAIAIVGIGCQFADAPDLHAYWNMMMDRRDGFSPIPADRWNMEAFFSKSRRATDKSYTPSGGFIEDIRSFPALHFGIPPRRVEVMDPQQRFAIEMGLRAIQDAGYAPSDMPRRTGVFVGCTATEYRDILATRIAAQMMGDGMLGTAPEDPDVIAAAVERVVPSRPFSAPGVLANMLAASVAQELDLHGPAYTTDAACASSLIALSDAVSRLRNGDVDAALAGGVYICVSPLNHIGFSRIGAISQQGVCRPFDHRADGFVQGDGAAMVLLKRLEDAQQAGDRIYAVIRGVAINNDGRGDGPMAPILEGQSEVIRLAWEDAGVTARNLGYVEAHGTGTDVGDETEFKGLLEALVDLQGAALGSAKANVGHTMSAAGVAGLIRAALALHYETIPPMANYERPKETLGLEDSPFDVPVEPRPWKGEQRLAAVSSFGFGGTNGHMVVESAPTSPPARTEEQAELITLSAPDEASLRSLAGTMAQAIRMEPSATVSGVARTLLNRPGLAWRLAFPASTIGELIASLETTAAGEWPDGAAVGPAGSEPRIALLFPGQGAQRLGMMRALRERFPIIRDSLEQSEAALGSVLPIRLSELLYPEGRAIPVDPDVAAAELTNTAHCQPALFACHQALWALLDCVGVRPVITTGHSLGEFNASVAAGALDPADGALYAARRGAAMASVEGDPGKMVAVRADRETVQALLVPGAVIANENHPSQYVVSGNTQAVAAVAQAAEQQSIPATMLDVSHAFHSPIFETVDGDALLGDIQLSEPELPIASGIADRPSTSAQALRSVMRRHASSPVKFMGALEQCAEAGADVYLQVGAGGPLASFARRGLNGEARAVLTLASMDDDDGGRSLLTGLGWLWVHGTELNLEAITGTSPAVSLTPHPLPREPYWMVKSEAQLKLKIRKGNRPQATHEAPSVDTPPTADASSEPQDTLAQVVGVVAKVSSYPKHAVQAKQKLVEDLGFDSLMVADLATGLADEFPGLGGLPQELLMNAPTVQDIVDFVNGADRTGADEDDNAPLTAFEPHWIQAELRGPPPHRPSLDGLSAVVVGDPLVAESLTSLGVTVRQSSIDDASTQILVWRLPELTVETGAVLSGDAAPPNGHSAFLAAAEQQARLGNSPHVVLLCDHSNPWHAGAIGAIRALAREWPDSVCKAVDLGQTPDPSRVAAELVDADTTTDVRWDGTTRSVLGLASADTDSAWSPDGKTVMVTGGTRGIGAQFAARLIDAGAHVLLVGRSAPSSDAQAWLAEGKATAVQADVTQLDSLRAAVPDRPIHAVVHCAGVLADGALGSVNPEVSNLAMDVKVLGWLNALRVAEPNLEVILGVGSWAGRFGNRHQAHYAAANSAMSALSEHAPAGVRAVVAEFGPWSDSDMVKTIPAPVQAAMRSEGVDFVGDEAGMEALMQDLRGGSGPRVRGRRVPHTTRAASQSTQLSVDAHPYLTDHALQGVPVMPLASAVDAMALVSGLPLPLQVDGLRLFSGVAVREPVQLTASVRGERTELRLGAKDRLAYTAQVRPADSVDLPARLVGGEPIGLTVEDFYEVTFHGPKLAGIVSLDAVGPDFARGVVRTNTPADWIPQTDRSRWVIDPLALDSAFQLAAMVAWDRYRRAGTPVSLGQMIQLRQWPEGNVGVDIAFGEQSSDRFSASFAFFNDDGELVALARDAVAELRQVDADADEGFNLDIKPEWIDPSAWPEIKDLEMRLQGAEAIGISNPYFSVHEGTAKNTTVVDGRELINFSSYNYLGLSGDPRVLDDVADAIRTYGTSVSASRVASGERPFHGELERLLAEAQRCEDSVVFTSGHATNVTTIGHLMGPGDLILHDELIHDSALQGIKLSGAGRRGYRHEDPEHLEQLLLELRAHHEKVLIIVEGVYSMDGDICNLPAFIELKRKYGCLLMVDEAHSFGIVGTTGCGLAEHFDLTPGEVDLWMGTLSKSLASCGGWIAGSKSLVNYLRYTAPGFVYSAGITPANAQAALSSMRWMLVETERVERLQRNGRHFHAELTRLSMDTGPALGGSGVIPVITGNSFHALMLSQRLMEQGINVQPIVYPAVADDAARLRFFLSSTHTLEQLTFTAERVAKTLEDIRVEFAI